MLIQGVDKGPKLFSMESDGWEEPRRGVSTRPALVPARQGTEEPARSSSGCGERLEVETHGFRELKWDQKSKRTCLHLCVRSLLSVQSRLLFRTLCLGLTGADCLWHVAIWGQSGSRAVSPVCLILGHLHHPQSANYPQHGALMRRNMRADRHRDSPGALSVLKALAQFPACW